MAEARLEYQWGRKANRKQKHLTFLYVFFFLSMQIT